MSKIIVYTDSDTAFDEVIELLRASKGNQASETFWDIPVADDEEEG